LFFSLFLFASVFSFFACWASPRQWFVRGSGAVGLCCSYPSSLPGSLTWLLHASAWPLLYPPQSIFIFSKFLGCFKFPFFRTFTFFFCPFHFTIAFLCVFFEHCAVASYVFTSATLFSTLFPESFFCFFFFVSPFFRSGFQLLPDGFPLLRVLHFSSRCGPCLFVSTAFFGPFFFGYSLPFLLLKYGWFCLLPVVCMLPLVIFPSFS